MEENDDVKCEICYDTGIVFDGKSDYLTCICDVGKELSVRSGGRYSKVGDRARTDKTKPIHYPDQGVDMTLEDMMSGMPYPDEDSFSEDLMNGEDY